MNTIDIERILQRRGIRNFDGVFSADKLPEHPRLLICNTDPSTRPGQHWICIYVNEENGRGEYFCSYGRAPNKHFETYLNDKCVHWTYNDRQLQSIVSHYCAFYCIYYCLLKRRGLNMRRIVDTFSSDTGYNDYFVHAAICRGGK